MREEKDVGAWVISQIRHQLRDRLQESYYITSINSHLRIETIKKIESDKGGSYKSVNDYVNSFCNRFPSDAYRIFYNVAVYIASQKLL